MANLQEQLFQAFSEIPEHQYDDAMKKLAEGTEILKNQHEEKQKNLDEITKEMEALGEQENDMQKRYEMMVEKHQKLAKLLAELNQQNEQVEESREDDKEGD